MEEVAKKPSVQVLDRVGALTADVFIIFPLILLLTSGIREKLNEYVTLGLTSELFFGKILILFTALGLIGLYRSLFQTVCRRTVGQKLLKITVEVEGDSKTPIKFMRLFLWNFVGLLFPFCILNFSIFYSEKAESVFDSLFGIRLSSEFEREYKEKVFTLKQIRGLFEAFMFSHIVLILVIVAFSVLSYQKKGLDQFISELDTSEFPLCDEINDYHTNWRDDDLTKSRIETAIALFGIGKIGEDCLNLETNFALRADSSNELGYLGAYLISQSPNSKTSFLKDLYLSRICDEAPQSDTCKFSKALSSGRAIEESEFFLISRVWSVKRDLVFGKFKSAKNKLRSLPHAFGFDLFITQMNVKLKALLEYENYSDVDMSIALSTMDNFNQLEFSRWICYEDLKGKCGGDLSRACEHFVKRVEPLRKPVFEDEYLLGKILSCHSDIETSAGKNIIAEAKKYSGDQKSLEEVIFSSQTPEFVKLDAIHRLIEITDVKDDVIGLANEWARQSERDFRWRKLGESLTAKLQSIQEKEIAKRVFYNLVKEYGRDEFLSNSAINRLPASLEEE